MDEIQARKYLAVGGEVCPYCSGQIAPYSYHGFYTINTKPGRVFRAGCCLPCKRAWTDEYALVAVDDHLKLDGVL